MKAAVVLLVLVGNVPQLAGRTHDALGCLRLRGGITAKKMAGLGDGGKGVFMPPALAEYLETAIEGGLDDDRWTSDSSARAEYHEWMQQADFWRIPRREFGDPDDAPKPLQVPDAFQADVEAQLEDMAAERRGEIGLLHEQSALRRAQKLTSDHKRTRRVDRDKAKKGDAAAQYNLGVALSTRGEFGAAVKWFQKAARQGHGKALYNLGICVLRGQGVARDVALSLVLLGKAAHAGHMLAEYQRALFYLRGLPGECEGKTDWTVKPDARRAVKYLARAGGGGVVAAQTELARCCLLGVGMERNVEAARGWLSKAAAANDARAMLDLGCLLLRQAVGEWAGGAPVHGWRSLGKGTRKDLTTGLVWLHKAADKGEGDSLFLSAALSLQGALAQSEAGIQGSSATARRLQVVVRGGWLHVDADVTRAGNLLVGCSPAGAGEHDESEDALVDEDEHVSTDAGHAEAIEDVIGSRVGEFSVLRAIEFLEKAVAPGEGSAVKPTSWHNATLLLAGCLWEGVGGRGGRRRSIELLQGLVHTCRNHNGLLSQQPSQQQLPLPSNGSEASMRQVVREAVYRLASGLVLRGARNVTSHGHHKVEMKEAVRMFREGAEAGDVRCMVNFAALCLSTSEGSMTGDICKDNGVQKDRMRQEAVRWLKFASDMGCGAALMNLALYHLAQAEKGGIKQEGSGGESQFIELLERAANAGDVAAQWRFDVFMHACVFKGRGVGRRAEHMDTCLHFVSWRHVEVLCMLGLRVSRSTHAGNTQGSKHAS